MRTDCCGTTGTQCSDCPYTVPITKPRTGAAMSERTNGLTPEQIRAMFDNCMRRLDDYHFVQCMRRPRCTCHLAIVKDAILANFNAMHNAGIAAERERAARVCDDRAIVYDGLEDAASTRYFADKMRGAREGSEQCAAAIRALVEGKP